MIPQVVRPQIMPMAPAAIAHVRAIEERLSDLPQVAIATHHVLHGGMYSRTIKIDKGVFLIGVLVKVPTILVLDGDVTVNLGEEAARLQGHCVIPASAGRKQAFLAHEDTYLTMSFATDATSIEQAEAQFTDEADMLISRNAGAANETIITGE